MCYRYLAGTAKCIQGCVHPWMCVPLVTSSVVEGPRLGATNCLFREPCRAESAGLPFLPAEHITPAVNELRKLTTHTQLMQLLLYVEATWLSSSVWYVAVWSTFGRAICTNNDVEGWHHRMNSHAGHCKLQFYSLLNFLYEEAKLVPVYALVVSEGKLTRLQQKSQQRLQNCGKRGKRQRHSCSALVVEYMAQSEDPAKG